MSRWVLPAEGEPPRALAAMRRKHAALVARTLAVAPSSAPLLALGARLTALLRERPDDAVDVLFEPSVAVLVLCEQVDRALPLIAYELAARRLLGTTVRFDAPVEALWSVARGFKRHLGRPIAFRDGEIELEPGQWTPTDALGGESLFPRVADFALALYDPNPLASLETHPEKTGGNAVSLGGRSADDWRAPLETALGMVRAHLPALYDEMKVLLRQLIPVGFEPERHLSASYREYIGAVYLTLHPNPVTLAEALVHEFQHNKLNLLSHQDAVLENGYAFLYRSPVRPDPRPLMGILLAAHAFVPVAELLRRLIAESPRPDLQRRLAEVVGKNEEALRVLRAHGKPTALGAQVLAELEELHATHAAVPRVEGVSHEA